MAGPVLRAGAAPEGARACGQTRFKAMRLERYFVAEVGDDARATFEDFAAFASARATAR